MLNTIVTRHNTPEPQQETEWRNFQPKFGSAMSTRPKNDLPVGLSKFKVGQRDFPATPIVPQSGTAGTANYSG